MPRSSAPLTRSTHGQIICFRPLDLPTLTPPLMCALSISQVAQILHAPVCLPLPGSAPAILGITLWQHSPLIVLDLAWCLGGSPARVSALPRLLVARATTTPTYVGLPVQPDLCIRSLPLPHRPGNQPLPWQAALFRGQFVLENETLVIPDLDRLLLPQEPCVC
ncbi:MAG: hypothetical protein FJZ47_16170 [Candidatus Tectomicrobia bacterium]|uniref:CheW-like domain-containing protein n=1 Tax=Tectimicrobiota bacterium TaxID=2528274 RepID=A0A937W1W0_UNCTE|nr:hypothetical protein [Candidatus Tectomicrobia bacterium]